MSKDIPITRRQTFAGLGAAGAGLIAARLAGIPDLGGAATTKAATCLLTPEQEEGPYYVDLNNVRTDITEGRPGVPLRLRIYVVDADTCKPIRRAAVDIWHCDALGVYSGVQGNSGTFMRGVQRTNANGLARFTTVYPGWYTGRAVHIHVKVHVGGNVVHTGQFFFDDALTDAVYKRAPYSRRGARDVRDSSDSIYRNGGNKSLLAVKKNGAGYVGSITMGVHRS